METHNSIASYATVLQFGFLLSVLATGPTGRTAVLTLGAVGGGTTLGTVPNKRGNLIIEFLEGRTPVRVVRGVSVTGRNNKVALWICYRHQGNTLKDRLENWEVG